MCAINNVYIQDLKMGCVFCMSSKLHQKMTRRGSFLAVRVKLAVKKEGLSSDCVILTETFLFT